MPYVPSDSRFGVVDGNRALYCPVCASGDEKRQGRWVVLARHLRESKLLSEEELHSLEFVAGPCAVFLCHYCGYGEFYMREAKERREADEDKRSRAEGA